MVYIDGITLIGNFLIEAVSCKQFQFEIVKIYQYSKIVNNSLQDTMYSVKFFPANIIEFLERFPEFLHASGNIVVIPKDDVKKTKRLLNKYFRKNLNQELVQILHKSAESILKK